MLNTSLDELKFGFQHGGKRVLENQDVHVAELSDAAYICELKIRHGRNPLSKPGAMLHGGPAIRLRARESCHQILVRGLICRARSPSHSACLSDSPEVLVPEWQRYAYAGSKTFHAFLGLEQGPDLHVRHRAAHLETHRTIRG